MQYKKFISRYGAMIDSAYKKKIYNMYLTDIIAFKQIVNLYVSDLYINRYIDFLVDYDLVYMQCFDLVSTNLIDCYTKGKKFETDRIIR